MRISIAMTTFNGGKYLREQLNSFIAQVRAPDELIVCDDGSTDDTLLILKKFKDTAPFPVMVISNNQNLGYTKNFEKALSYCSGDLIFLADQDDIWHSNKIATVEKLFQVNPNKMLAIHDGELVDENLVSYGATKRNQIVAGYGTDDSFITGALTTIRSDFLPFALPIPSGITGHDGWLHNIARLLEQRIVSDQCLQHLRRHSSNTSSWIASSVKPISKVSILKSRLSTFPPDSYLDRLHYNTCLLERLKFIEEQNLTGVFAVDFSKIISSLQAERKAITSREKLIKLGFFSRKLAALKMLAQGDYAYFNGLQSCFRDLVR